MTLSSLLGALPGAMSQGLIWGIMAIGVFITFKVLDIADLTVDGTLCTGGAVCVVLIIGGYPMWLAILLATLAGMAAGLCTGLFHTLFGIPAILAGILTQFALWSVNLRILGGANQAISADKYDLLTSLRYLGNSNIPFWKNPLVMISVFLVVVIALRLLSVAFGSIIYYVVIQVLLWTRLIDSNDLKLLSAIVVALFLAIPYWKGRYFSKPVKKGAD